jgi:hypothetical protein
VKPVPLLARIRVATPCTADWNEMTGDERVRHCAHCKKDVFNLSDMSREQAERLIIEKRGDLCARYYQRSDGTILLADCSIGLQQKRKTRVLAAGAAMLLAGTGGAASYVKLSHHRAAPAPRIDDEEVVMGRMAPAPPAPEVEEVRGQLEVADPDRHEVKGQMVELAPPVEQGTLVRDPRRDQIDLAHARARLRELQKDVQRQREAEQVHTKLREPAAR